MQSSLCTSSRCLVAAVLTVLLFILMSYSLPQMSIIPASISSVFYTSTTPAQSTFGVTVTDTPQPDPSSEPSSTPSQLGFTSSEPSFTPSQLSFTSSEPSLTPSFDINVAAALKQLAADRKVPRVDCQAIYNDSESEIKTAKTLARKVSVPIEDADYLNLTADCPAFISKRGYVVWPPSKEEAEFPLAYSLLVFKEVEMVERLLRAIYRPQNYYCIHVDKKSHDIVFKAVASIAQCFPNVFLASRRIDVQWGWFSVLEPELVCMEELWRYPRWKYFINLTGQEFPLRTNYELVKILTVYDGANDLEGTIKRANKDRWHSTPPLGIRAVKGSVHITVNRDFVGYILFNQTAQALLEWAKKSTSVPDETFFATLNHNPQLGIRGSYKGVPETDNDVKPFLTRYKNWGSSKCASGKYVRAICILSSGDLPALNRAKHYFANKFYLSEDRVAIGCLEERLFNNTRDEFLGLKTFDTSYYASLAFVSNKV